MHLKDMIIHEIRGEPQYNELYKLWVIDFECYRDDQNKVLSVKMYSRTAERLKNFRPGMSIPVVR